MGITAQAQSIVGIWVYLDPSGTSDVTDACIPSSIQFFDSRKAQLNYSSPYVYSNRACTLAGIYDSPININYTTNDNENTWSIVASGAFSYLLSFDSSSTSLQVSFQTSGIPGIYDFNIFQVNSTYNPMFAANTAWTAFKYDYSTQCCIPSTIEFVSLSNGTTDAVVSFADNYLDTNPWCIAMGINSSFTTQFWNDINTELQYYIMIGDRSYYSLSCSTEDCELLDVELLPLFNGTSDVELSLNCAFEINEVSKVGISIITLICSFIVMVL